MDDLLDDPRCMTTPEALLIDGANGACRDARLGSRDIGPAGLALVVLVLAVAWAVRTQRREARSAVLFLAIASAIPGAYAMLAERADRPAAIAATAEHGARLHDALRSFARRHGCARVRTDECQSCFPVARLALAGLACDRPASIDLYEGAESGRCVEHGSVLSCGGR